MGTFTNWGAALISSLATALALVFSFVPKLIGFLVILLIGWIVASAIAKAITFLLRRIGFERAASRIGLTRLEQELGMRMNPAALLGRIVYWFVFLIFVLAAVDALGLPAISSLLDGIIAYIPNVFVAVIVLLLGMLVATFVADLLRGVVTRGRLGNPNIIANIARYAIIGFAVLVALYQLQIAPALIETLFLAIIGAVALAFGLAFGLGGRDTAKRYLERSEGAISGALPTGATTTQSAASTSVNYMGERPPATYPDQVRNVRAKSLQAANY